MLKVRGAGILWQNKFKVLVTLLLYEEGVCSIGRKAFVFSQPC